VKTQDTIPYQLVRRRRIRGLVEVAGFIALAGVVAASAMVTKEAQARARLASLTAVSAEPAIPAPIAAVTTMPAEAVVNEAADVREVVIDAVEPIDDPLNYSEAMASETVANVPSEPEFSPETRWFNARPVRPARTIWMTVTAYSPDSRSCGDSDDGITSSIHNVYTNGMKLVAADSRILPLGTMISVPGYDNAQVVPVLDRGGAIKGHRLDLLFPTHEAARKWGVKHIPITVWEYADGKPKDDFRKIRDSKN
jgi:3D (Asp-Asp-Asp) domain-containing protein